MHSKQDYFRSPLPKNIQSFYSPFRMLRNEDDPFFIGTLASPLFRNSNSSFSPCLPSQADQQQNDNTHKVVSAQFVPRQIQVILSFDNEDDSLSNAMETPQSKPIKIASVETAPRKKYDLRFTESSQKQRNFKDGERGLRALSKQAYEIIQHSQPLTYQEVAERIIEENESLNDYPEKAKEKQSIKRRVYDALNVLISIGLLEKNGKRILMNKNTIEKQAQKTMEKTKLAEQALHKSKVVSAKRERLAIMKAQKTCLQKLLCRNKGKGQMKQKISLPFIIASELQAEKGMKSGQVKVKNIICADMDALGLLELTL